MEIQVGIILRAPTIIDRVNKLTTEIIEIKAELRAHPSYPLAAKLQKLKADREGIIKDLRKSFKGIDGGLRPISNVLDEDEAA